MRWLFFNITNSFFKLPKKVAVLVSIITIFLLSATVALATAAVLFEVTIGPQGTWSNSFWGQGDFTHTQRVAVEYKPSTNQEACTIKHGVFKFNNPTDNMVMKVKSGGIDPSGGSVLATVTVPNSQIATAGVPTNIPFYTTFTLSPCLNLTANTSYYFIFSRTTLNTSAYYGSQFMPNNLKPELFYWVENFAAFGGWNKDTSKDFSFRVEGPETLAHTPVLIVPGMAGTKLYNGSNLIWADLIQMAGSLSDQFITDNLSMNSNGSSQLAISIGDVIERLPPLPIIDVNIFEGLKEDMEDNGYLVNQDLFFFPYDWRLNLDTSKDTLNEKIEQIKAQTGLSKVNIIVHSMGGLLTKDYINTYGKASIDKLIFVGTPHLGAPKSAKTLFAGDNIDISILNPARVKEIGRNMSSLYELTPKQSYFSNIGGYLRNISGSVLNYNDTKSLMLGQDLNSGIMDQAETFFAKNLENTDFSGVDTYNIAGCKNDTQAGYNLRADNSIGSIGYSDGDKTVPLQSADYINISSDHKFYLKNTSHGNLPSQDDAKSAILQILSGTTVTPTGKLKSNTSECGFSGKTLAWHSPVAVHIYDSQNRHTGPIENDAIENSIPGVDYEIIGHDKFVYLPTDDGQTYQVSATGLEIGTFDLVISENNNGTVGSTTVYNDVPVTNTSTVSFSTSSASAPQTITVDNTSVPVSATITGSESADLTPPVSNGSKSGTAGTNGWYTSNVTVTLSATDENSGILNTKYSLDGGATYLNYGSPFVVTQEGISNIKYYSVDRAGNNEAVKNLEVKIDKNISEISLTFDLNAENFVFNPNDPNSVTFSCTTTTCTSTSQGGNQTVITFTKSTSGNNIIMQLNSVSYNGVTTTFPSTIFTVRLFELQGNFRDFDQTYTVSDIERLKINYFWNKDESKVTAKNGNVTTKQVFSGKKFLKLNTNQGQINYVIN